MTSAEFRLDDCLRKSRPPAAHDCVMIGQTWPRYDNQVNRRSLTGKQDKVYESFTEPITGLARPASDYHYRADGTRIRPRQPPMVASNALATKPLQLNPSAVHSVRMGQAGAPPHTRRGSERDPGGPYLWSDRKEHWGNVTLGLYSGNKRNTDLYHTTTTNRLAAQSAGNLAALKYMYTSNTQRSYSHVPWDEMLARRPAWAPVSTLESMPHMGRSFIDQRRAVNIEEAF